MDAKEKVKKFSKDVKSRTSDLRLKLEQKNTRLIISYVKQLTELKDELELMQIRAEEEYNEEDPFMVNATSAIEQANAMLGKADEYQSGLEESEEKEAVKQANSRDFNYLKSDISSFLQELETTPEHVVDSLDLGEARVNGIDKDISIRKAKLKGFFAKREELESRQIGEDFEEIGEMLKRAQKLLDRFVVQAERVRVSGKGIDDGQEGGNKKGNERNVNEFKPCLKLDRLALPVFRGNIRHFARFVRDFEKTVGRGAPDPDVKLMYLQGQCLEGTPKEVIRNLTNFDTAMARLKERYGKVSMVVDAVLKDIGEVRVGGVEESRAVINLARCLEKAWDDMEAIGALDEFCNIMTVRTVEGKLSTRLQLVWAERKGEGSWSTSKETMWELRNFIERHRKIAEEVNAMGGKRSDVPVEKQPHVRNDKKGSINLVTQNAEGKPKKACFRCGYTNHQVKDCRVPSSIKCRRCGRIGHIENACDKPPSPNPGDNSSSLVGNCSVGGSGVRLPVEQVNTDHGTCNVLWDSGSMINLVSAEWVEKVGLKGKNCTLDFKVVDNTIKRVNTQLYEISLIAKDGSTKAIEAYGIERLAADSKALDSEEVDDIVNTLGLRHEDIDNKNRKVDILIGSSCIKAFPITRHSVKDICLMSSEYGTRKLVVAGNSTSDCHYSEVGNVCNAQFVGVTTISEIRENLIAQVKESCSEMSERHLSEDKSAVGIYPSEILQENQQTAYEKQKGHVELEFDKKIHTTEEEIEMSIGLEGMKIQTNEFLQEKDRNRLSIQYDKLVIDTEQKGIFRSNKTDVSALVTHAKPVEKVQIQFENNVSQVDQELKAEDGKLDVLLHKQKSSEKLRWELEKQMESSSCLKEKHEFLTVQFSDSKKELEQIKQELEACKKLFKSDREQFEKKLTESDQLNDFNLQSEEKKDGKVEHFNEISKIELKRQNEELEISEKGYKELLCCNETTVFDPTDQINVIKEGENEPNNENRHDNKETKDKGTDERQGSLRNLSQMEIDEENQKIKVKEKLTVNMQNINGKLEPGKEIITELEENLQRLKNEYNTAAAKLNVLIKEIQPMKEQLDTSDGSSKNQKNCLEQVKFKYKGKEVAQSKISLILKLRDKEGIKKKLLDKLSELSEEIQAAEESKLEVCNHYKKVMKLEFDKKLMRPKP